MGGYAMQGWQATPLAGGWVLAGTVMVPGALLGSGENPNSTPTQAGQYDLGLSSSHTPLKSSWTFCYRLSPPSQATMDGARATTSPARPWICALAQSCERIESTQTKCPGLQTAARASGKGTITRDPQETAQAAGR